MYGTKEGLKETYDFFEAKNKRIVEECNPQDIYNYEWNNYECMISYDDTDVIKLIIDHFGVEVAKTIKRKYGYSRVEELV